MIDTTTPARIVDCQTHQTVTSGTYAKIKQLRNRAERMNLQYGAVRYAVVIDFIR